MDYGIRPTLRLKPQAKLSKQGAKAIEEYSTEYIFRSESGEGAWLVRRDGTMSQKGEAKSYQPNFPLCRISFEHLLTMERILSVLKHELHVSNNHEKEAGFPCTPFLGVFYIAGETGMGFPDGY